ncbi:GrpB family protein [Curtobacterium pusillum]|uniref:GrpB family protein n=1 Tax=Curtobacterium pusillum TaxID=69373 RepID=A0ABX2MB05_9MICO|nr:GrpB family protein [Curtobacterium pusillum]NUU12881.1 GrpB family protein [Curtobacterium pusillum]
MVHLEDPDAAWPSAYGREAARLVAACEGRVTEVEHIGSTAVPGLVAKPIIDVAARAAPGVDPFTLGPALEALGYRQHRSGPKNHGVYVRSRDGVRTHIVHVFAHDAWNTCNQRLVRDRLLHHADARARYAALKERIGEIADGAAPGRRVRTTALGGRGRRPLGAGRELLDTAARVTRTGDRDHRPRDLHGTNAGAVRPAHAPPRRPGRRARRRRAALVAIRPVQPAERRVEPPPASPRVRRGRAPEGAARRGTSHPGLRPRRRPAHPSLTGRRRGWLKRRVVATTAPTAAVADDRIPRTPLPSPPPFCGTSADRMKR